VKYDAGPMKNWDN